MFLPDRLLRRRCERGHRRERPLDDCVVLSCDLVLERDGQRLVLVLDMGTHIVQIVHGVVAVAAQEIVVLVEIDYDL